MLKLDLGTRLPQGTGGTELGLERAKQSGPLVTFRTSDLSGPVSSSVMGRPCGLTRQAGLPEGQAALLTAPWKVNPRLPARAAARPPPPVCACRCPPSPSLS